MHRRVMADMYLMHREITIKFRNHNSMLNIDKLPASQPTMIKSFPIAIQATAIVKQLARFVNISPKESAVIASDDRAFLVLQACSGENFLVHNNAVLFFYAFSSFFGVNTPVFA